MKMRKLEEQTVHFLFTMPTERKLVEFHKAKTIFMRPLAYSLINSLFFKKTSSFHRSFISCKIVFHKRAQETRGWPGDRTPRVILQRNLVPNRFQSRGHNVNFK